VPLKGGHGTVDLRHALEKSCKHYFYTIGNWSASIASTGGGRAGPAGRTGIDLPNEGRASCRPPRGSRRDGENGIGETISVADRPGTLSVTPLSLAQLYARSRTAGITTRRT